MTSPILTLLFYGPARSGNVGPVVTEIRRVRTLVERSACAPWCPSCQREPELALQWDQTAAGTPGGSGVHALT